MMAAAGFTKDEVLAYAALAECYSSHPISKSLRRSYGREIDKNRVKDVEEISGHGVCAIVDGAYAGCILISDVVKPGAREALADLKRAGVRKIIMLTGDAKQPAEAVAAKDLIFSPRLPTISKRVCFSCARCVRIKRMSGGDLVYEHRFAQEKDHLYDNTDV